MLDQTLSNIVSENTYVQKLFVAKVLYNKDELGLNRIKAQIPGKLEGSHEDLPWFAPLRLAPFGQGAGFGVYGTPPEGADLIVYLQNGDVAAGFYVAGYYGTSNANAKFANPNVWGFEDPSGTVLIVNTATETMTFTHSSGYTYTIDGSGNYSMSTGGSVLMSIEGSTTINTKGAVKITGSTIDLN